jgi:iron complex transport system substrate-binding protein
LYNLDIAALEAATPDVIVSQALCDVCAVSTGDVTKALHSLSSRPQIVDLEPHTLDDVFDDCLRVAKSLGASEAGRALRSAMRRRRATIAATTASIPATDRPGVVFLEWLQPPFNGGHWNPELIELAGGIDLLGAAGQASSTLSWPEILAAEPDVLFIACCGFSTDRALHDVRQLQGESYWDKIPAVTNGRVYVADGYQFYSRPGPGLLDGLEIMAHTLHPTLHAQSSNGSCVVVDRPLA